MTMIRMMRVWVLVGLVLVGLCGGQDNSCVLDPSRAICKDYQFPESNATQLVNDMCNQMPKMAHCSLVPICYDPNQIVSRPLCDPFSLYKDLCVAMHAGGSICSSYKTMCTVNTSQVIECSIPTFSIPPHQQLVDDVLHICGSMWMDGCEQCTTQACASPLSTYSLLCLQMPGMTECADWQHLCSVNNITSWSLCGGTSSPVVVPQMRMYFHTDFADYVLFKQWVPYDTLTYVASVIGVFAMAFLHEALRIFKAYYEVQLKNAQDEVYLRGGESQGYNTINAPKTRRMFAKWSFGTEFFAAGYRAIDLTLHFMIMLVTMTYNVGLFVAVIAGYALCNFILGRFARPIIGVVEEESCH